MEDTIKEMACVIGGIAVVALGIAVGLSLTVGETGPMVCQQVYGYVVITTIYGYITGFI